MLAQPGLVASTLTTKFGSDVRVRIGPIVEDDSDLHAVERAAVAHAVAKRRYEFAAGRRLCRALLGPRVVVTATEERAPVWPTGVRGTIAHTRDVCVVVVSSLASSVGIDVERFTPLSDETEYLVLGTQELSALPADDRRGFVAKKVFCAKEAFYKAQWPLTRRWVGFHDARVEIEEDSFVVETLVDIGLPETRHRGFFVEAEGFIFAGMSIAT